MAKLFGENVFNLSNIKDREPVLIALAMWRSVFRDAISRRRSPPTQIRKGDTQCVAKKEAIAIVKVILVVVTPANVAAEAVFADAIRPRPRKLQNSRLTSLILRAKYKQ